MRGKKNRSYQEMCSEYRLHGGKCRSTAPAGGRKEPECKHSPPPLPPTLLPALAGQTAELFQAEARAPPEDRRLRGENGFLLLRVCHFLEVEVEVSELKTTEKRQRFRYQGELEGSPALTSANNAWPCSQVCGVWWQVVGQVASTPFHEGHGRGVVFWVHWALSQWELLVAEESPSTWRWQARYP